MEAKQLRDLHSLRYENKQLTSVVTDLTSKIDALTNIVSQMSMVSGNQAMTPTDIDREMKRKRIILGNESSHNVAME
jgi:hypothetical protein